MERTLIYRIDDDNAGITVAQYLKKKGYSSANLTDLKKMPESILVNGKWEFMIFRLSAGDVLTVHIQENTSSEKIPPVSLPLDIVYEDEDLMVINKPADLPIHPSMGNYTHSLGNAVAGYFAEQNIPFVFRCINRLDHNTSGLTIVAKHMLSGSILSTMVKHREIRREYLGIVRGSVTPPAGTITAPLGRKSGSIIERTIDFENGESAITHYRVLEEKNGHSLVLLHLETSRTHQIRIHMKYLGFPLIGDSLYNPDMEFISRQALHSARLVFLHPITGQRMEFTAALPEDMRRVISLS
ncbi:MAG: RluA family pseudouridine synthase [Lachnospiraceae bacterium]|nr:RluA family pseudouridine synthase [Lachnospiraceae bacterium]